MKSFYITLVFLTLVFCGCVSIGTDRSSGKSEYPEPLIHDSEHIR